MADSATLTTLAVVWALAVMTPGPDFLAIVHASLTRSRNAGFQVMLGVLLGMTCWTLAALSGLGLLIAYWPWLHAGIKTLGAIYLLVLGVQLITGQSNNTPLLAKDNSVKSGWDGTLGWAVRRGLLTNLGNPKAMAIFSSMVAVALPTHPTVWMQGSVLIIMLGIPALWYPLVVVAVSHTRIKAGFLRMRSTLDRIAGGIFIYLGIRLAAPND